MAKSLDHGIGFKKAFRSIPKNSLAHKGQWDRFYIVNTSNTLATVDDIRHMIGGRNIEYIEQDQYVTLDALPVDSLFEHQWYLHNTGQEYLGVEKIYGDENDLQVLKIGTPGVDIRLVDYYDSPPEDHTRVVVAVLDTGVDSKHPDLQGQFWKNPDEIPYNGIDDDRNGYIDDTLGYDFDGDVVVVSDYIGDNDPNDQLGHGTHIAGIVAAAADEHGVVGVAPNARIMALSFFPSQSLIFAVEGLIYAVNNGANVINVSWGVSYELTLLSEALEYARMNNVFVSISAGNTGDNTRKYPAAFDNSFAVGASDSDGFLTDFSTWGEHVDLVAPGLDILSLRAEGTDLYKRTEPQVHIVGDDEHYYLSNGTSMSAPMVCGAAALLLAAKPDLSVDVLEDILRLGATDIVDPFNTGDYLPGPDTISGYGSLNVDASMALLGSPHLILVEPARQVRYTTDVVVKAGPIGGYDAFWMLEWAQPAEVLQWQSAAVGNSIPEDSILHVFDDQLPEGPILLKLTNLYSSFFTSFFHVRNNVMEMTTPSSGEHYDYAIPFSGSIHGPDYDSVALYATIDGLSRHLASFTGEFFDSLFFKWILSGNDTGMVSTELIGYFEGYEEVDTITVHGESSFAAGWPRSLGGGGAITPVRADLNKDGESEIIIATSNGICVFRPDGSWLNGFPVLTGVDMRCVPAIYDVDRDGEDEIICTNAEGIHVFNHDGTYAPGWPRSCITGLVDFGYGYPNPTVAKLGLSEDSAIVIVNELGQVLAYRFDGESYFFSMNGFFTSFYYPDISGGEAQKPTCDFVASVDLNLDGYHELVGAYTGSHTEFTGFGIFDGRTGEPAFNLTVPLITNFDWVVGSGLADFDGDSAYEILSAGYDESFNFNIYVRTNVFDELPGWPYQRLRDNTRSITSYPIIADLNLDGLPEVIYTSYSVDSSRLYIFNPDGTPYSQLGGEPEGVAFVDARVFGTPTVANLLGDEYPEIAFRSGYIVPGGGYEYLNVLDHTAVPIPDWMIETPTSLAEVRGTFVAPLIDDIDGDNLVELAFVGSGGDLFVWNFEASFEDGQNRGRFLIDNLNTNVLPTTAVSTDAPDDGSPLPRTVALRQNYPNPFNPMTTFEFDLPSRCQVTVEVFNILGQKVTTVTDAEYPAGRHRVEFNGAQYASGLYLYRLRAAETTITRKMMLLK